MNERVRFKFPLTRFDGPEADALRAIIASGLERAKAVIGAWSSGDLAGAVRDLNDWVDEQEGN